VSAQDRLAAVLRIKAVQAQKHRLEEWRLLQARRREAENQAATAALIAALDGEHPLHGLFVAAGARRLETLGVEARRLAAESAAQAAAALEQGRRLKACANLAAQVERACETERRKAEFLDYLDGALAGASSGEDAP